MNKPLIRNTRELINLSQRFVLFLLALSVIPMLIVGFTASNTASNVLQQESSRFTLQLISSQRDYLDLQLDQVETLLSNVSSLDNLTNLLEQNTGSSDTYTNLTLKAKIGYALNASAGLPGLVSVSIYTANRQFYHVGDTLDDTFDDQAAKQIFNETFRSTDRFVWLGHRQNLQSQSSFKTVAVVTKAISTFNDNGTKLPLAVAIANYSLPYIQQTLAPVNVGANGYIILIDQNNRVLYHPDPNQVGQRFGDLNPTLFSANEGILTQNINNVPMLVSYAKVETSGWRLIGFVPINTLTEPLTTTPRTSLLILVVILAIVAGLGTFYLNNSVIAPIRAVTNRFKNPPNGEVGEARLPQRGNDEIGQLVHWFNSFLDTLNERQKAEKLLIETTQERELLIKQLEESMRFKDEFLATMSHELRTPLNAILGFSELILMEDTLDPDVYKMTERIVANSQRLLALINDILDLSRLNAHHVELVLKPTNTNTMIRNWYNDFKQIVAEKGLNLELELAPNLPTSMITDESRLTQIAANLLHNAIKFTHEGKITISASASDTMLSFAITDTGIGIAESWKHRIFDEFRQVDGSYKREYGGAGLGLAIVKRLVTLLSGNIAVESQVGKGSKFTVTLPINSTTPQTEAAMIPEKTGH